jgi:hypothetical protein
VSPVKYELNIYIPEEDILNDFSIVSNNWDLADTGTASLWNVQNRSGSGNHRK